MPVGVGGAARRAGAGAGWLSLVAVTAIGAGAARLALPWVLGLAVDGLVAGGNRSPRGLSWVGWAALAVAVVVACDLVGGYAGAASVADTTARLRRRLVRHVLDLGPGPARPFAPGDLVTRVSSGAASAAHAGPALVLLVAAVLPPAGSLVLLAVLDPWLAGAFLAGLGLVALVLRTFTRRTTEAARLYQEAQGRIAGRLAEALAGARTIAAAGTAHREETRVLGPLVELRRHGVRAWHVLAGTAAQGALVGPLVLVAVLATGGLALAAGRITAGDLFAAGQYAVQGAGLGGLTGLLGRLARARAGAARLEEVLTLTPATHGARDLPPGPGRLQFVDVTVRADTPPPPSASTRRDSAASRFAPSSTAPSGSGPSGAGPSGAGPSGVDSLVDRSSGPRMVLDGITVDVPGGSAVAVVGRSGAGKSVLAALAARLRDPDSGTVLLDGVPLPELRHSALRAAVASAFERPVLVGDTVADAVGMGRGPARVLAATHATSSHDFVTRLPRGYGTALADAPMSGGEAQRLGLARAWHAGRLLVLDDATSSLDMVTEMRISRTLTEDHGHRTRLIVTHRVSTAARADLVVWLEDGRVRGVGPHDALWSDPGYRAVFPT
ncbi:ABC transporter ATP-binding protein [Longispora fulva]|uniref:ATP-binding cassette subfamily B protein n=1 Tax=Longispora fulva TaxID=619741 RepID=A0A8J7KJ90_9ACTN|nr:ABC transporter ATP-binding protein [Longispora fulva]MBG6135216.1 ATP-binding cassette subfamily B protein [Longispora fulva]GIG56549.1 ABC transporter ATP-binding protein [Longispora fulva]